MDTFFATAEKADAKELATEIGIIEESPVVTGLLHSVGGLLAILDEHRQILAINDSFLKMLGITDPGKTLGLRPGEALQCVHAAEKPHGCGTTKYCSTCGAAIAIVTSLKDNQPSERICALTAERGEERVDIALSVRSHPITVEGKKFLLLYLQDITQQENRAALERTFFHDLSNMLASLLGASELLAEEYSKSELAEMIYQSALNLKKEISIQQCLTENELSIYHPLWTTLKVKNILNSLELFFSQHAAAHNKELRISSCSPEISIESDHSLVMRVLCNMITNALEAEPEKSRVDLWVEDQTEKIIFCVRNEQVIPDDVSLRIFQRNFSTKNEAGRGIGTFSMKLFGEKILKGKISFTSSEETGTIFKFALPAKRGSSNYTDYVSSSSSR